MATADPYQDLDPRLARALRALREELDERLAALRTELGLAARPGEAARSATPDYGALLAVVQLLDEAEDQGELLARMLEGAGRFAERALFLLVRDGEVEGWGGLGFPAQAAAAVRAGVSSHAALSRCVERRETVALSADQCRALVGTAAPGTPPLEGLVVPFALRGRVAGVLYADRSSEGELNTPALQLLAYTTANTLETLPLRKGAPAAPAPAPEQRAAAPAAEEAPAESPPPPTEAEADAVEEEAGGVAVADRAAAEPAEAAPEEAEEEVEPAPLESLEIARSSVEVAEPPGTEELPAAEPEPPPSEAPRMEELAGTSAEEGSIEVAPPADLEGPGWAFTEQQASEQEGRHEEARRLARLLVTEIKLYNEEQVEEGLERGDLYATLQEEIDRSRRIFEERIPADVRAETDYFREELVRILADGDSSALGR